MVFANGLTCQGLMFSHPSMRPLRKSASRTRSCKNSTARMARTRRRISKNSDLITCRNGKLCARRAVTNRLRVGVNVVETRNELAQRLLPDPQPPEKLLQNVGPGLDVPLNASRRR